MGECLIKFGWKRPFQSKHKLTGCIRDFCNQASLQITFRYIHISEQKRM